MPTLLEADSQVAVSPYDELLCYEYLYSLEGSSLKKIVESTVLAGRLPHEAFDDVFGMLPPDDVADLKGWLDDRIDAFRVVVNKTPSWPERLSDSNRPSPLLYYMGDIALLSTRNVSIVGARKASGDGLARAASLASRLIADGITVTTGLAAGIDTAATSEALRLGGRAICVIGTPITEAYPKENKQLQQQVSERGLVVSQVPLYKYSKQPFKTKKYYFPERNELMAAISDATVIVEASDTSGTLTQARACLNQGRPLYIMRSCIESASVTWPEKYLDKPNVHVLDSYDGFLDSVYG